MSNGAVSWFTAGDRYVLESSERFSEEFTGDIVAGKRLVKRSYRSGVTPLRFETLSDLWRWEELVESRKEPKEWVIGYGVANIKR